MLNRSINSLQKLWNYIMSDFTAFTLCSQLNPSEWIVQAPSGDVVNNQGPFAQTILETQFRMGGDSLERCLSTNYRTTNLEQLIFSAYA